MQCAPILRYHDIIKQHVTDMYRRDRACMEQIKPRFSPSGPPILQLLKRKPLERTVFMQELRYPPHSCASYSSGADWVNFMVW